MSHLALQPIDDWFQTQGWTAFDFQRETWRAYLDGRSGLVHAPTGMGKTYAVWLGPLAERLQSAADGHQGSRIQDGLQVLWLTPLRALANDTMHNLLAAVAGLRLPWRVELRHGDTSATMRRKQRDKPPEALVTTPESLSVLLSYPGSGELLRGLRCVIVDEWHELLATKRGVQTELALAHLRSLSPSLRTWGLSATLGNTREAMKVLLGRSHPRAQCDAASGGTGVLIRGDSSKQIVVRTLLPEDIERFPWSGHIGVRLLDGVIEAVERARTTLIFTNVRSAAEIWFQAILKKRPDLIGQVALHHGSLDRDIRQEVEGLLREGRIRCVVCTSSLDLGVDFSPVDQVLQIGSPKGVARMMQRAGRSGHQPGATSTIVGVPTMALEMIEFAAARDASRPTPEQTQDAPDHPINRAAEDAGLPPSSSGVASKSYPAQPQVESREPLDRPLDVLVQHMVTLASGDGFDAAELRDEVRATHAFENLTDDQWRWCLDFVERGGGALGAYPQFSRVTRDACSGRYAVTSKLIERMHRLSIGTITSDSAMNVAFANGSTLGMIEEGFISRLRPGDRFVFAGRVLELVRVHNMTAFVRPAKQRSGVVPRWAGGRSPLSTLLSQAIRLKLDEARRGVFDSPEMTTVRPLLELQARWSIIPAPQQTLIERTRTRDGHHLFIFPFEGRLVHEGLCSLVAHRLTRREPRSVQVTGNDYGFELQTLKPLDLDEEDLREMLSTDHLVEDLLACLNTTALARRQFREIARVAGLLFPGYPGQPKSMRQLQASSELFFDVFSEFDPRNLLLDQARREVLDRELEVMRLRATLERIARSTLVIIDVDHLTPLSFPLWAESIRTQQVSSESWSDRVQRMVVELEKAADSEVRCDQSPAKRKRKPVASTRRTSQV